MIRQATVADIGAKRVTRIHGHVVVVTQYYPRFLKKNLIHEYAHDLAPTRKLLTEFKTAERADADEDHDRAFDDVDYESKFTLSAEGLASLQRLAEISRERTVYLVCHCKVGQRCHREILMIAAEKLFGAKIGKVHFPWTTIRKRIDEGRIEAPEPDASL